MSSFTVDFALTGGDKPLARGQLVLAAIVLAAANFVVVLDTTIANVSVPNIAGGLGASSSQGTLVITSYAVAEAITVPLTGWLASRFGSVRVFITAMVMFGLCSVLCGLALSLGSLVVFRVLQGLAGGPLMPLSQTLLLRIFPKEKAAAAVGLWGVTALIAPVLGPILGGKICDGLNWPFIFFINVPIALGCACLGWQLLKRYETASFKTRTDAVGLGLLVVWVAAMQIMLDEGKNLDWFASHDIVILAVLAVVGFLAFLIWELTADEPVVDLRVFRHRGFTMSVVTTCLGFGAFFGSTVLAILAAPLAASLSGKLDSRLLVFLGVIWLGLMTLLRTDATSDMTLWQISSLLLFQGVGLPFFFMPLTSLALSSVDEAETASAAGLMNFCRTVAGAFATSLVQTAWENRSRHNHEELAGLVDRGGDTMQALSANGFSLEQARGMIEQMVQGQAVMVATNQIFLWAGLAFILTATAIWFAPKPTRAADTTGAH
jgi:DHA2 family multidrug resistance protein